MSFTSDNRIFSKEWCPQRQCWCLVLNPAVPTRDRRRLTRHVDKILREPRLLAYAELKSACFFEPEVNTVYYFKLPNSKKHPALFGFNTAWLHEHGILQDFHEAQRALLHEDTKHRLAEISVKAYPPFVRNHGHVYQFGVTNQPGGGLSRSQLSAITRDGGYDGGKTCRILYSIASRVMAAGVPELDSAARRHEYLKYAALISGSSNNLLFTNYQLNYSAPRASLKESIGKFGDAHPDPHDDPTSMTFMLHFSHLSPDDFGGRFIVPAFGAALPMHAEMVCGFSARFIHFATSILEYPVPTDSPLRHPTRSLSIPTFLKPADDNAEFPRTRLTIPIYTDVRAVYPRFAQFNTEIFTPQAGRTLFEKVEDHQNWMMNFFLVFEDHITSTISIDHSADEAQLFGKGGELLSAAVGTYAAWALKGLSQGKANGLTIPRTRREATSHAKNLAAGRANLAEERAEIARKIACINTNTICQPMAETVFNKARQFRKPEFYANLFGWRDATGDRHLPSIGLVQEIIAAITTPNPEFEELKNYMENLCCGKRFRPAVAGESIVNWTESDPSWGLTKEGVSGNPGWEAESKSGTCLQDVVQEATDLISARRVQAVRLALEEEEAESWLSDVSSDDEE